MKTSPNSLRIGIAAAVVVGTIGWLAWSGYGANKSYYVTIAELGGMGDKAFHSNLRVEGFVVPGSIEHDGPHVTFVMNEFESHTPKAASGRRLTVIYKGKAASRPLTPSRTTRRPWPREPMAATANSMRRSCKPSAPASTPRPRPALNLEPRPRSPTPRPPPHQRPKRVCKREPSRSSDVLKKNDRHRSYSFGWVVRIVFIV
jgi:hypothetical protein